MRLVGLARPRGATPRERRAALLGRSDLALGRAVHAMGERLRVDVNARSRRALAAFVGLDEAEVVASPFALRIVALAARVGATTVHQELRATLPPNGHRSTDDADHDTWKDGFLAAGKYQQFGLEDPLAIFHPAHTSKWGPHELCHRAIGFFHREGASRFELYLGARLNELVPVVTWYGLEQALRADEGAFDRAHAGAVLEASLRRALWLRGERMDVESLRLAGSLVREGLLHLERELGAIDEETTTGRIVPAPHAGLDASSDAIAYVAAHAAYLESPATERVLAAFAREGIERFASIAAYRAHVEAFVDALLFESFDLDLAPSAGERDARLVWDLAQRAARTRAARKPGFPAFVATLAAEAASARTGEDAAIGRACEAVRSFAKADAASILAIGLGRVGLDRARLLEGLETTCPTLAEHVDLAALADALLDSADLRVRASLPERVSRHLAHAHEAPLADVASLDAAVAKASRGEPGFECLTIPRERFPSVLDELWFVANPAFSPFVSAHDPLDPALPARRSAFLVGRSLGEVAVVQIPVALLPTIRRLERPTRHAALVRAIEKALRIDRRAADGLLDALLESGALGARSLAAS